MNTLLTMAFEFHWDRFTQPAVIVGLCLMLVGLVMSFCSRPIADAIGKKRKEKGEDGNVEMLYMAFKYVSLGVMLIGMLVAIIKMQY